MERELESGPLILTPVNNRNNELSYVICIFEKGHFIAEVSRGVEKRSKNGTGRSLRTTNNH